MLTTPIFTNLIRNALEHGEGRMEIRLYQALQQTVESLAGVFEAEGKYVGQLAHGAGKRILARFPILVRLLIAGGVGLLVGRIARLITGLLPRLIAIGIGLLIAARHSVDRRLLGIARLLTVNGVGVVGKALGRDGWRLLQGLVADGAKGCAGHDRRSAFGTVHRDLH